LIWNNLIEVDLDSISPLEFLVPKWGRNPRFQGPVRDVAQTGGSRRGSAQIMNHS
jgi:hypothetical protein